jgi:hypothetical protein
MRCDSLGSVSGPKSRSSSTGLLSDTGTNVDRYGALLPLLRQAHELLDVLAMPSSADRKRMVSPTRGRLPSEVRERRGPRRGRLCRRARGRLLHDPSAHGR